MVGLPSDSSVISGSLTISLRLGIVLDSLEFDARLPKAMVFIGQLAVIIKSKAKSICLWLGFHLTPVLSVVLRPFHSS